MFDKDTGLRFYFFSFLGRESVPRVLVEVDNLSDSVDCDMTTGYHTHIRKRISVCQISTQVEQSSNLCGSDAHSEKSDPLIVHIVFRVEQKEIFAKTSFFDSIDSFLVFRQSIRKVQRRLFSTNTSLISLATPFLI